MSAASVVVLLMVGVVVFGIQPGFLPRIAGVHLPPVNYAGRPGVPGQVLLPPLRSQPVRGWRVDVKSMLPADAVVSSIEYFGNVAEKAYFTIEAIERADLPTRTWVLGVDVSSGATVFAPVEIGGDYADCYVNGPHRVVCLTKIGDIDSGADLGDVWVIDADAGKVIAHGPTDLRPNKGEPPHFEVTQAGDYAIASQYDVGTYGIGDQGQRSWFVAGQGTGLYLFPKKDFPGDPPSNLAMTSKGHRPPSVFSVADGTVVAEAIDGWVKLFMGGYVVNRKEDPELFEFYDQRGAKAGQYRTPGHAIATASDVGELPVLTFNLNRRDETQLVFDHRGAPMAVVQTRLTGHAARFLGPYLYARTTGDPDSPDAVWDKFDLKTGSRVSSCHGLPLDDTTFVGSDGTIVIGRFYHSAGSDPLIAVDTNTCDVVWQIPHSPPMWTIGKTLVQASPDNAEITSLVPPAR
ncbi:hypothetical protein BST20_24430 [Mycobacterium branderi]|uniref:Uncharacterized protein n=1 Tax=Mycobacterium branderi TaxID=43348 RepID=A0AA91LSQ2_9MYCO|nr:hypothetical protein BST20_24430 [Mycobacterium branderi]